MHSAKIHSGDGSPGLYINGIKKVPVLFGLSDIPGSASNTAYAQRNIANFAKQGIHLVTADTELKLGWYKQSAFEWEPLQEEIAGVLQADPDSAIILRLHMNPPYWWMRDHPDELVIYNDKPGLDNGEQLRLIRDDHNKHMRVSLASQLWLAEAGECLKTFCQRVWDTPEGRAILGIQVACGINGEWHQWGCDCSKPMKERFHRFLKEKYGTDEALQKAWGNPNITIETAPFSPDPAQPGDDGIFRDPVKARNIMDSQLCIQLAPPEAILHFCKIIKENWGREVLTGAFYAYYLGTGGDEIPIYGHLLPEVLYQNRKYIDFLCEPFPYYDENRSPQGVPMQRGLLESTRLRGMLWLTEMDQAPAGTADFIGGDPNRMNETIAQLRRNVMMPIMSGIGMWYYDHRLIPRYVRPDSKNPYAGSIFRKTGWWDNPLLLKEINAMQRLFETYALKPYRPAADVLVVYTPGTHFAQAHYVEQEYAVQDAIQRAGAVCDCIYLNELEVAEMERYRCVIFPNAYRLDAGQRQMIRERTKGKQVIWLYAAGFSDDETLSEVNMRNLMGISVKRIQAEGVCRTCAPLAEESFAVDVGKINPMFAVDDPDAEKLAVYSQSGECAAAHKGDQWYFGLTKITPSIAAYVFRQAGVHIYCTAGDPILSGCGMLAINSFGGGERVITLRNGKVIQCELPPLTTAVFDADSGQRLL